jgi:sterol 3beta-glucosyltransferase
MRIVLSTFGTRGDVQPFVALGHVLRARGHDVVMGAPMDHVAFARASGLTVMPIHGSSEGIFATPEGRRWIERGDTLALGRALYRSFRELADGVERDIAALTEGADIVVAGVLPAAMSRTFAEARGVPFVLAHLAPGTPSSTFPMANVDVPLGLPGPVNRATTQGMLRLLWRLLHDIDDDVRDRLGLPHASLEACLAAFTARATTLHLWSPSLLPPPPEWGHDNVVAGFCALPPKTRDGLGERAPVDELEAFLAAGPPPIFLGLGSMPLLDPRRTVAMFVDAVTAVGARAIVGGTFADTPGGRDAIAALLPSSMRLVGNVDHDALFPRCAAVLHHGGAGSTHTGLRAGRATMVCSVLGDQPFWGRVVARHGAGTWTRFRTLTTSTLRRGLETLLRDDVQARARALGEQMRTERPGTDVAADVIERVATRR